MPGFEYSHRHGAAGNSAPAVLASNEPALPSRFDFSGCWNDIPARIC
jgi:hypothetical protein